MRNAMRVHAVEEFVRELTSQGEDSTRKSRKVFIWDDGGSLVSGDWLQWLPLIIQLLEIISEWLNEESLGDEARDLHRAIEMMPSPERLKDLIYEMKSKGE